MADCNPHDCPVGARVNALEGRFNQFEQDAKAFHEKLEGRVRAQETTAAVQDAKLDTINDKLDTLISWRAEQDNKPNRLIDHLKENAVNYIMLAMLGLMMLKMGL